MSAPENHDRHPIIVTPDRTDGATSSPAGQPGVPPATEDGRRSGATRGQPPQSLWGDLRDLLDRHPMLKSLANVLFGGAAALAGAWAYFSTQVQSMVDHAVARRIAPYEATLDGVILNQVDEYETAAEVLNDALGQPETAKLPADKLDLLYDRLLYAMANTRLPERYSHQMTLIKERIKSGKMAENAWRFHQIGWHSLNMGRTDEAEDYFERAKRLFDANEEWKAGSDPARGLAWVALAKGDPATASAHYKDAADRNPKDYAIPSLVLEMGAWPKERWFKRLEGLYKARFTESFAGMVKELKGARPSPVRPPGGEPALPG